MCGPRCGEKRATVHHLDRNSRSSFLLEWKEHSNAETPVPRFLATILPNPIQNHTIWVIQTINTSMDRRLSKNQAYHVPAHVQAHGPTARHTRTIRMFIEIFLIVVCISMRIGLVRKISLFQDENCFNLLLLMVSLCNRFVAHLLGYMNWKTRRNSCVSVFFLLVFSVSWYLPKLSFFTHRERERREDSIIWGILDKSSLNSSSWWTVIHYQGMRYRSNFVFNP